MVTGVLYTVISLVIAIAINAGIIMLAVRIVGGFMPKFLMAVATAVVECIVALVVSWILGKVLGGGGMLVLIALLVIIFLIDAAILNVLIKRSDGSQMGFGKSCLATLIQFVFEIVLAVLVMLIFGAGVLGLIMSAAAMH